jgi:hypothetical protein
MTDFERSIARVVERDIEHVLGPFGTAGEDAYRAEKFTRLRHAATILCRRMQTMVPALLPCEVMAMLGLVLEKDEAAQAYSMIARLLLSAGWPVAQNVQFYQSFRKANPELWDLQLARLLARGQLQKTYGLGFGDVIADLLVEPRKHPLLYAMLYGNITEPIEMVFRTAFVPLVMPYDKLFLSTTDDWLYALEIPAQSTATLDGHYINHVVAKRLYGNATDGNLPTTLTLSETNLWLPPPPRS